MPDWTIEAMKVPIRVWFDQNCGDWNADPVDPKPLMIRHCAPGVFADDYRDVIILIRKEIAEFLEARNA